MRFRDTRTATAAHSPEEKARSRSERHYGSKAYRMGRHGRDRRRRARATGFAA
jgi:hypothetical protein